VVNLIVISSLIFDGVTLGHAMRWLLLLSFFLFIYDTEAQSATEIVRKAEDKLRGTTSIIELKLETIRPTWKRTLEVKAWMKGNDWAMLLITAPVKEKGIVYLKRKKEVWNRIPALERNIKLPPSMMGESWMGTDFTNDDLVKESSAVVDYDHQFFGDTVIDERPCYRIVMTPKKQAAVIWSKVILCIDKKDFLELHSRFYDEDGAIVNTINSFDIQTIDGRLIPTRFELLPANKPGQKTVMQYKSIRFNTPIEDRFFTTENMSNVK
jgi:outer membrane lipoprotein-sorting protein